MAHRVELESPIHILSTKFEELEQSDLRVFLGNVILGEKDSLDTNAHLYNLLQPYSAEFTELRKSVASFYRKRGGSINPLLEDSPLPHSSIWPGIIKLVEQPGFESEF